MTKFMCRYCYTKEFRNRKGQTNHERYCSGKFRPNVQGRNHPNFKGGKILKDGYKYLYLPEHPFCDFKGYVKEHRIVIENDIGRYLKPNEEPHHIDFDKHNNNVDNLHLFIHGGHTKYHNFLRRIVREFIKSEAGDVNY